MYYDNCLTIPVWLFVLSIIVIILLFMYRSYHHFQLEMKEYGQRKAKRKDVEDALMSDESAPDFTKVLLVELALVTIVISSILLGIFVGDRPLLSITFLQNCITVKNPYYNDFPPFVPSTAPLELDNLLIATSTATHTPSPTYTLSPTSTYTATFTPSPTSTEAAR